MARKIRTLKQLKALASDTGGVEVFILLGEDIRIIKRLWYYPPTNSDEERWDVYTQQGDTYDEGMNYETLETYTLVIEALNTGTLFEYD